MSRRAMLLETKDVPKYIREIASRMRFSTPDEIVKGVKRLEEKNSNLDTPPELTSSDWAPGYVFRVYGRRKLGAEIGSAKDIEKLIKWANSWGAACKVLEEHNWYEDCPRPNTWGYSPKSHKNKAYREGYRNYWIILLTDPVCRIFEINNFFKEGGE